MSLLEYKSLIDGNLMHIATVSKENKPNLCVATDVKVISENQIMISHNEMQNTPSNILNNPNIALTSFNDNMEGIRIFGKASYYTEGEYFDLNIKEHKNENTNPKGVIIVKSEHFEELK